MLIRNWRIVGQIKLQSIIHKKALGSPRAFLCFGDSINLVTTCLQFRLPDQLSRGN